MKLTQSEIVQMARDAGGMEIIRKCSSITKRLREHLAKPYNLRARKDFKTKNGKRISIQQSGTYHGSVNTDTFEVNPFFDKPAEKVLKAASYMPTTTWGGEFYTNVPFEVVVKVVLAMEDSI